MLGKKQCPKCNASVGARTKECGCGYVFYVTTKDIQPKKRRPTQWSRIKDWTDIQPGDTIKIIKSGPYYVKDDRRIRFGYYGKFRVHSVTSTGLHCFGNKKEGEASHCFIRMIKPKDTSLFPGVIFKPYKCYRLNNAISSV
jgi:hypothetical protein